VRGRGERGVRFVYLGWVDAIGAEHDVEKGGQEEDDQRTDSSGQEGECVVHLHVNSG
jgi:hypothetical protein